MQERNLCLLEIHSAVVLFGMTALFGKFLHIPAQYIVLGRVFFASLALGLFFMIKKVDIKLGSQKDYWVLLALGALLAFHWTSFYKSIQLLTVALALLLFSAYPIFVTFIEPILFHEKIKKVDILISFVMFLGILIIVPPIDLHNQSTYGIFWGIISCLSFAFLSLFNRKYASLYRGITVTFYEQVGATLALLPLLFFGFPPMSKLDWQLIIILGVIFTGCAHSLLISGMKLIRAQTVGIIASLETVYGIIFAAILLKEFPSANELFGGAVILSSAFISTLFSSRSK